MRPKINPELRVEADWTPATCCKCVMETNHAQRIDSEFNVLGNKGEERSRPSRVMSMQPLEVNVGEDVLEGVLWRVHRPLNSALGHRTGQPSLSSLSAHIGEKERSTDSTRVQ